MAIRIGNEVHAINDDNCNLVYLFSECIDKYGREYKDMYFKYPKEEFKEALITFFYGQNNRNRVFNLINLEED